MKQTYWTEPMFYKETLDERRERVLNKVYEHFHVTKRELIGRSRVRHIVEARNLLFYFFYHKLDYTYNRIGDHFGRGHVTIMSGSNRVKGFMDVDSNYKDLVNYLIN